MQKVQSYYARLYLLPPRHLMTLVLTSYYVRLTQTNGFKFPKNPETRPHSLTFGLEIFLRNTRQSPVQ